MDKVITCPLCDGIGVIPMRGDATAKVWIKCGLCDGGGKIDRVTAVKFKILQFQFTIAQHDGDIRQ